jgi:hypothetical protein
MRNSCIYANKPVTFRRSSTKILEVPGFKGYGGNLQNIEKSMREIYIPDGFSDELKERCIHWLKTSDLSVFTDEELDRLRVFSQADQSGAEALIVAYECEAKDYRKLFIHNISPHVYVAMHLFEDVWVKKMKEKGGLIEDFSIQELKDTPIEKLKENPFWYDLSKLIKSSDDWLITERYYYLAKQTVHCMDKETEVLTQDGWKQFDVLLNTDSVAIYSNAKEIFFEPVSMLIYPYNGDMLFFAGDEVNQFVTPNHKMVYGSNGVERTEMADYVFNLLRPNIPTSGMYKGGSINLKSWQIKLLVAIQADGNIASSTLVRFKFAKDRKIDRLLSILKEGNVEYRYKNWVDTTSAGNIVSEIDIYNSDLIKYFLPKKEWGSWLLTLSRDNLILLIDELKNWDGTFSETYLHKREEYCSYIKNNLEWIKTICHLINKQGTLSEHKLGINNRRHSIASRKSKHKYNGLVYCLQTSTEMFLVRRKGKISVTHNSANYDIKAPTFRMNILEKSGGKIFISKADAERFLLTYRGLFPEIPERNRHIRNIVAGDRGDFKYLYNIFGFPFCITEYEPGESTIKEYYAWSAQSSVGEITRIAFTDLYYFIQANKEKWDILADTHDSYMVQHPLRDTVGVHSAMSKFLNQKLLSPFDGTVFNMRSEVKTGFNWSPSSKENPDGLQSLEWI